MAQWHIPFFNFFQEVKEGTHVQRMQSSPSPSRTRRPGDSVKGVPGYLPRCETPCPSLDHACTLCDLRVSDLGLSTQYTERFPP